MPPRCGVDPFQEPPPPPPPVLTVPGNPEAPWALKSGSTVLTPVPPVPPPPTPPEGLVVGDEPL